MKIFELMVLIIGFIAGQYKTTHAELLTGVEKNGNVSILVNSKDNKTVIELKDITVNTGLNLDKALAQLNGTEASYIPKIRKVTLVGNDGLEVNETKESQVNGTFANVTTKTITTPQAATEVTKILTEGGGVVVGLKVPVKNNTEVKEEGVFQKNFAVKPDTESKPIITNDVNKLYDKVTVNSKNIIEIMNQQSNQNKTLKITTTTETTTTTLSPLKTDLVTNSNTTKAFNATTTATPIFSKESKVTTAKTRTTHTTTTTTTSTTTTTTTTTTPKPKKPTITYSVPDFPDLENDNPELKSLLQSSATSSDGPYAQPSQEFTSNSFQRGRDFILPIVSMIFIIPLVIGIIITSYRRFRDCWSTRHYRRMDFLVDGMYND